MASTGYQGPSARDVLKPLMATCIVLITLQTVFLILRIIARLLVKRAEIGWDDYLIIPGFITNIGGAAAALVIVHYETIGNPPGHQPIPNPNQPPEDILRDAKQILEPTLKAILAVEQLALAGNTFPKLSILCLYLRIFPGRKTRIFTYITMAMVLITWLAWFIFGINACTPVQKQWDKTITTGKCYARNPVFRSFLGPNTLPDICILLIPIPTVWGLEATRLKKIGISVLFLMGSLGFATSIAKWVVYFVHDSSHVTPAVTTPLLKWIQIEPAVYLIAACLPALRPLVVRIVSASWMTTLKGGSSANRRPSGKRNDYSSGASPGRPWDSAEESKPRSGTFGRLQTFTKIGKTQNGDYGELQDFELGGGRGVPGLGGTGDRGRENNGTDPRDLPPISQPTSPPNGAIPQTHNKSTSAELGIPWADDPVDGSRYIQTSV